MDTTTRPVTTSTSGGRDAICSDAAVSSAWWETSQPSTSTNTARRTTTTGVWKRGRRAVVKARWTAFGDHAGPHGKAEERVRPRHRLRCAVCGVEDAGRAQPGDHEVLDVGGVDGPAELGGDGSGDRVGLVVDLQGLGEQVEQLGHEDDLAVGAA